MKPLLKVQFISRDLPSEGSGGTSVYRLSLLRYLKKIGCEIEYLLLHYRGEDTKTIKDSSIKFKKLFKVTQQPTHNPKQFPIWSDLPTTAEINFLEEKILQSKPDLIIADHPWLGGLFNQKIKDKTIVTAILTHDVQYQKIKEFSKYKINPYKRNKGYPHTPWNKQLEQKLLSNTDIILAIQKEDRQIFQKMLPLNEVQYLPMAPEGIRINYSKQIKGRCLFVGGSAQHNAFGLAWFLSKVWSLVLKEYPPATLHICGEVYKEMNLMDYKNEKSIIFRRKVKNLSKEYNEAQVCIIPLRVGSGLKIKLVEAMAYGKACVSTQTGVQGIKEVAKLGVIVTQKEVAFANAIIKLFKDKQMRDFYGRKNREYAQTYFTPEAAYRPFILRVLNKIRSLKQQ